MSEKISEEWRDIKDYPSYQVSNLGRVRSIDRMVYPSNGNKPYLKKGKIIKHYISIDGYPRLGLYRNKKSKHFVIHRLVAEAFIPNPENLPVVNHIDGNKENNLPENLEWCTTAYNNKHAFETGLNRNVGEEHHSNVLTWKEVTSIRQMYDRNACNSIKLSEIFKCSRSTIQNVLRNIIWKDENYHYKYEDVEVGVGQDHVMAKLTEKEVLEIRAIYAEGGISYRELGEMYGMEKSTIGKIITRKLWKHI